MTACMKSNPQWEIDSLTNELGRLRHQLAAFQQDKAILDWLDNPVHFAATGFNFTHRTWKAPVMNRISDSYSTLREAVTAAMAIENKQ